MGHNKLENQIKEKLNAREIQPSAQAWDRLDAMLSIAEEKKTKRSFGWLYIAASVLVLLSVGLFLFNQKNTGINPQNEVVNAEPAKDTVKNSGIQIQTPTDKNEAVASSDNQSIINQSNNNQSVSINQNQSKSTNINQSGSQGPTVKNNPLINRDKPIEYQGSSDVALKDLPKIVEPKTTTIPAPRNSLSDEQLLAGLDKTAKETTNKQAVVKVDPRNLLSQVDGELDQTFRERVISKVRKNYKEVKVALANRNNE